MQHHINTKHKHWAAWLLMLAVFLQAFVPALAQAAAAQTQAPWGQICSSASPADKWTQEQASSTPADHAQNPHCAYCLLGGAAAPPPPACPAVWALGTTPLALLSPAVAPVFSRSVWLTPPLRAPPRTFA